MKTIKDEKHDEIYLEPENEEDEETLRQMKVDEIMEDYEVFWEFFHNCDKSEILERNVFERLMKVNSYSHDELIRRMFRKYAEEIVDGS